MIEFLQSHTNVVYQPPYHSDWYSGINPYALGFAMWRDIRRICEAPTTKTATGFPTSPASPGARCSTCHAQFKDESFVAQFLSPR
jgi:spore cortex formation protein SpoVR/YcgB (stage V sporulation)